MTRAAWVTIVVAGTGTYFFRSGFLLAARRLRTLPPTVVVALRMIPAAALSAICAPIILRPEGAFDPLTARVPAALIALWVAWKTGNIALTIAVGLAAVLILSAAF